jgi:putative transposase
VQPTRVAMSRSRRHCIPGLVHHVYNRAVERKTLFEKSEDYSDFLALLAAGLEAYPIQLLAYCIMPNHWHLLLVPTADNAISAYVQWVCRSHAIWYRRKTQTIGRGHVYQSRFCCIPVADATYYWRLMAYVEGNAARAALVTRARDWPWSSLAERAGRSGPRLLSAPVVPLPENWADVVDQGFETTDLELLRTTARRNRKPNLAVA